MNLIVAHGLNREIGLGNELLWKLPKDMERFKKLTMDHAVVMGRKTYESIGRPLPGRTNMVVTSERYEMAYKYKDYKSLFGSLPLINESIIRFFSGKEIFIIGGESLYKQYLPFANRLYITKVHGEFKADTYFPEYDHLLDGFINIENEKISADENNPYDMTFLTYEKNNKK